MNLPKFLQRAAVGVLGFSILAIGQGQSLVTITSPEDGTVITSGEEVVINLYHPSFNKREVAINIDHGFEAEQCLTRIQDTDNGQQFAYTGVWVKDTVTAMIIAKEDIFGGDADTVEIKIAPPAEEDSYEPNDSETEAAQVTIGDTVSGAYIGFSEMAPHYDEDWYSFEGTAGNRLQLSITKNSCGSADDLKVRVYNPNGDLVGEQDVRDAEEAFLIPTPVDGTYKMVIVGRKDVKNSGYSFVLTPVTQPAISVTAPTEISFPALTELTVSWTTTGTVADEVILLLGKDGLEEWTEMASSSSSAGSAVITLPIPPSDAAGIKVAVVEKSVLGIPQADTSEAFTITQTADSREPNDSMLVASELVFGDTATGSFISTGTLGFEQDEDWYTLTLDAPAKVELSLSIMQVNRKLEINLMDTDGNTRLGNANDDESATLIANLPVAGTYYVVVTGERTEAYGNYSLVAQQGDLASLTITAPAVDTEITDGQAFEIAWDEANIVNPVEFFLSDGSNSTSLGTRSAGAGTYSAMLPVFGDSILNAMLIAVETGVAGAAASDTVAISITPSVVDLGEPDDDMAGAHDLALGEQVNGFLHAALAKPEDKDYYKFTLDEATRLRFAVTPVDVSSGNIDLRVSIFNEDGDELTFVRRRGGTAEATGVFGAGTYYAAVHFDGGAAYKNYGNYTLLIEPSAVSVGNHAMQLLPRATGMSVVPLKSGMLRINYALKSRARVQARIYSLSGRLVSEPINEVRTAGWYSQTWDNTNIANGQYLLHMRIGEQTFRQPVFVVR